MRAGVEAEFLGLWWFLGFASQGNLGRFSFPVHFFIFSQSEVLVTMPHAPSDSKSNYYFLNKESSGDYQGGSTSAVRDGDGGEVFETLPDGATEEEFAPRILASVGVSQD